MSTFNQLFPPAPTFTERNIADLSGKVYIITGAASGIGLELAKILYSKNATVYIAARSLKRAKGGIDTIKNAVKQSRGNLEPMVFDLGDLKSIKPAVQQFQGRESRLDVLFLNAGVMTPPANSKTVDGYDLELGTNCLGSFLLTRLLEPTLKQTVAMSDTLPNSVRVVWVASLLNLGTPQGGVKFDNTGNPVQLKAMDNYMQSKAGVYFLSHELAQRSGDGVVHVCLNPGLMKTELQRHGPPPMRLIMGAVFKGPKFGAYTELYAGLNSEVQNGNYYIPWGRRGFAPDHLEKACKASGKGESTSMRFYGWCEREVQKFM
ncbi:NAD(P)-binding protein [Delitschia confertaspora ATCC 74209]|uniref:NAD(P)-binding protein n=1 Tax=Delitschia confertaspora ATCC 74209 TaxID=1513339 RepID=A0A9P4JUK4_9PLEO|nr:NAD(P)-binding protein [Delitschia confertaspora ATCC 74209]